MAKTATKTKTNYQVPSSAYPGDLARPEHLKSVMTLFAGKSAPLEKAKVLEIGCSTGEGLLQFALSYPNSENIGINFSADEANEGMKNIKDLKIKNIQITNMDIEKIDSKLGSFDYILCRNIFSWVSDKDRERIFDTIKSLLSKNGLAVVGYNTLPGCNMLNNVRDLMKFHAGPIQDKNEQTQQARASLAFIKESLEGRQDAYADFMSQMADTMNTVNNQVLREEFLSEENKAFYFSDFVLGAAAKKLVYVGDTNIEKMYFGNLPQKAAETLSKITKAIQLEQYIDFINNTRMRNTILTHPENEVNRDMQDKELEKLYYFTTVRPHEDSPEVNIEDDSQVMFYVGNTSLASKTPVGKSILIALYKNMGAPLSIKEIVAETLLLNKKLDKKEVEQGTLETIKRLILGGSVQFLADKPKYNNKAVEKPKASPLVLAQSKSALDRRGFWVTNTLNQMINFDPHQVEIIKNLDGKHTIEQITDKFYEKLKNKELSVQIDKKDISDTKELKQIAANTAMQTIEALRVNFCLI